MILNPFRALHKKVKIESDLCFDLILYSVYFYGVTKIDPFEIRSNNRTRKSALERLIEHSYLFRIDLGVREGDFRAIIEIAMENSILPL